MTRGEIRAAACMLRAALLLRHLPIHLGWFRHLSDGGQEAEFT